MRKRIFFCVMALALCLLFSGFCGSEREAGSFLCFSRRATDVLLESEKVRAVLRIGDPSEVFV